MEALWSHILDLDFSLFERLALVVGLLFTPLAYLLDLRSRSEDKQRTLNQAHRQIWSLLFKHPELARVFDPDPDLNSAPVTPLEERLVLFLIHNLQYAHRTSKSILRSRRKELRKDVGEFFALPIPQTVWRRVRDLQAPEFIGFVESSISEASLRPASTRSRAQEEFTPKTPAW